MSASIQVAPQQVAAAKLKVKRALARGLPVDDATRAIAGAQRREHEDEDVDRGGAESRFG